MLCDQHFKFIFKEEKKTIEGRSSISLFILVASFKVHPFFSWHTKHVDMLSLVICFITEHFLKEELHMKL